MMDEATLPEEMMPIESDQPAEAIGVTPIEDQLPADEPIEEPVIELPSDAEDVKATLRELRMSAMRAASSEGAPDLSEAPDERAWFVVHCYSGYENKVKHNLE